MKKDTENTPAPASSDLPIRSIQHAVMRTVRSGMTLSELSAAIGTPAEDLIALSKAGQLPRLCEVHRVTYYYGGRPLGNWLQWQKAKLADDILEGAAR